jgi:molybdate transport system ATP-binding protein
LKIFINADDIALSSQKLEAITIQNQLEGTISDVIKKDNITLCLVNVGFDLFVEITRKSLKRMNFENGSKVWCLFKSVTIDVAG